MSDEDENLTILQIESNNRVLDIGSTEGNISNNISNNCKQAINTILELNEDEIAKIEANLRDKILNNGEKFMQKYDLIRADSEKMKIEYEQHFAELETSYLEQQSKFESELKNSHLYQAKFNENEEKLSHLIKTNKLLTDEKETFFSNQQRLSTVNQNLEIEKRELYNRVNKLMSDNDQLNKNWKTMNIKLTESQTKVMEITSNLEDAMTRESSISFREKQYTLDKQRLMNEIQWLNDELQKKSTDILKNRSDGNAKNYEFEVKIDELTADNKNYKSQHENLQIANGNMETQIEDLTQKLQELREKFATNKQDFEEETISREKLLEMYKDENTKSRSEIDNAATAILEFQHIISDLKNEYAKLADEKKMNETAFDAKFKENTEKINKLEQELKNANELLSIAKRKGANVLSESDIQSMSPAAAVASNLLKNGMTLTQIYSEYVNLAELLQKTNDENQRLRSYVTEITRDIEEKAPIFKRQRKEYEEAINNIATLTNQLEKAMMDYEVLKSKSEDSIKKYNLVSSENIRLRQDVSDLSRQVTVLLHEVEKLRSKLITASKIVFEHVDLNKSELNHSIEVTSSDDISKDLLIFRDIEELQKQNQKLVRLVHEITDKKKTEEKIELELKTKEYDEKLMLALRELEEFRAQREKHEHVLEDISKQRDHYKQLLIHYQQNKNSNSDSMLTSTPCGKRQINQIGESLMEVGNKENNQELENTTAALKKIQKQFENYQNEMMSTNKSLNDDVDNFRSENSSNKMKLALCESKLESSIEKCKTLNTAIDKCRRELETAKERNSKFNDIIIKHEQSINLIGQDNKKINENICEYESKIHTLTFECNMHKSNHERLVKERDLLIQENSSRSSIMNSLEAIKDGFNRNERETQLVFKQKIEQLERDNHVKEKGLEQNQERHDVLIKSWQSQYDQLVEQKNKENVEFEKMKIDHESTKTSYDNLKEKFTEIESKLHSNEMIVQMTRNTKSSSAISRLTHLEEESKDLQMKMSLAEKEIVSLKIQLEESRNHAKQYKTIGDTMEKALKESSETSENIKQVLDAKIAELTESNAKLNNDLNEVSTKKQELEISLSTERQSFEQTTQKYLEDKNKLFNELELLKKNYENLEQILAERTSHRDEYVAKLTILEEQLNETQLKLSLTETQLNDFQSKENDLERSIQTSKNQLEQERKLKEDLTEANRQTEEMMNENLTKLKAENESLTSQINVLQTELNKMGQDLLILQKQDSFKSFGNFNESSSVMSTDPMNTSVNNEQSSSNLLEINRFLRTQKDQAEEKYETIKLTYEINQQRLIKLENDLNFYKRQSQAYEADITHLQNSLENFKNQTNLNASYSNPNTEQSVSTQDNFNLIMDTNKRLKEEIDSLNSENTKIKAEVVTLEEDIANVKANLSESDIKKESFKGENNCMKIEVKRWKNRVDALLSNSDNNEEWNKIKLEMQEAKEKNQELTNMINELRTNLNTVNSKHGQITRESVAFQTQVALEKVKATQEFDTFKTDKNKREEMFKSLVADLKEVVTLVLKELQLKDIDWASMRGPMNEKLKFIKEELATVKRSVSEKVKKDKDELAAKIKQASEKTEEVVTTSKKFEETEAKLKERELRIGQMMNFISSNKTRLSTQKKSIDELTKELADLKANQAQQTQNQQQTQDPSAESKDKELTAFKSRLLQSKLEIERLKKELDSTNSALIEAHTKGVASSTTTLTNTVTPSASNSPQFSTAILSQQQPKSNISSTTSTTLILPVATTSTIANTPTSELQSSQFQQNIVQQSQIQPTPTAYIAPSLNRVTKVIPQPLQQQAPAPTILSLRKTAAVQPTPHDSGSQNQSAPTTTPSNPTLQRQQQQVTPTNVAQEGNQWQQQHNTQSTATTESSSQQDIYSIESNVSSQPSGMGSSETAGSQGSSSGQTPSQNSGSFITKRTREDDQPDDIFQSNSSSVNSKKQRSSTENQNVDQQIVTQNPNTQTVATIEPFTTAQNTEGQGNQESNEEILLDEDSGESDIVVLDENEQNSNQLDDYENSQDDGDDNVENLDQDEQTLEPDEGEIEGEVDEEEDDEENDMNEEGMMNDDETNNANSENNEDQGDHRNDDDQNETESQEFTRDTNTGDKFTNQESNQDANQPSVSPDSSAAQNQQNIHSSLVSSESTNVTSTNQQTVNTSQAIRLTPVNMPQSTSANTNSNTNLFANAGANNSRANTFGSAQTNEQRREAPKPIVWSSGPSNQKQPQQLFQNQTQTTAQTTSQTTGSNFRIRRAPVPTGQNVNQGFQSQSPNNNNTTNNNSQNYFQQELQTQFQQQGNPNQQQGNLNQFRFQNSPNNQFQLNNNMNQMGQMGNNQQGNLPENSIINLNNSQMGQPRSLMRGAGTQRGRGAQNRGRGGGNPSAQGNLSNRGGRQNFQ